MTKNFHTKPKKDVLCGCGLNTWLCLGREPYTSRIENVFNIEAFFKVTPETPQNEVKSKFRKLSILVHPDKNANDQDRAKKAFDGEILFSSIVVDLSAASKKLGDYAFCN